MNANGKNWRKSLNGYLEKTTTDVFKLCFNLTTGSAAQWFYAKFSQLEII